MANFLFPAETPCTTISDLFFGKGKSWIARASNDGEFNIIDFIEAVSVEHDTDRKGKRNGKGWKTFRVPLFEGMRFILCEDDKRTHKIVFNGELVDYSDFLSVSTQEQFDEYNSMPIIEDAAAELARIEAERAAAELKAKEEAIENARIEAERIEAEKIAVELARVEAEKTECLQPAPQVPQCVKDILGEALSATEGELPQRHPLWGYAMPQKINSIVIGRHYYSTPLRSSIFYFDFHSNLICIDEDEWEKIKEKYHCHIRVARNSIIARKGRDIFSFKS